MKNDGSTSCAQRVVLLKNGVLQGNPNLNAKRCGAKAKRTGKPCLGMAMRGKNRCRLHGGKSTGPKTVTGKERSENARLTHGLYTKRNKRLLEVTANYRYKNILTVKWDQLFDL